MAITTTSWGWAGPSSNSLELCFGWVDWIDQVDEKGEILEYLQLGKN